jgi:hypothetical protein
MAVEVLGSELFTEQKSGKIFCSQRVSLLLCIWVTWYMKPQFSCGMKSRWLMQVNEFLLPFALSGIWSTQERLSNQFNNSPHWWVSFLQDSSRNYQGVNFNLQHHSTSIHNAFMFIFFPTRWPCLRSQYQETYYRFKSVEGTSITSPSLSIESIAALWSA